MNKVLLIGRLVRDPEDRITSGGRRIAKFSLAVSDARNAKQTFFFNCTAWETQADYTLTYLKKGSLIAVDGRVTMNSYTSKDGRQMTGTDIMADSIKSIGSKPGESETSVSMPPPANINFEGAVQEDKGPPPASSDEDLDWTKALE